MQNPTAASSDSTLPKKHLAIRFVLLAGLCIGVSFFFDAPIDMWMAAHRGLGFENVAKAISRYGAWHWLMGIAIFGLAISWFRARRDWMRILAAMMIASSVSGLSADCLRGLTGRTRPNADVPQGWYGIRHDSKWLVGQHAYNSFPSGHTAAITGFAVALWLSRRKHGSLLLLAAAAIAASRIYLRDHHFSDIVAGAFLGVGVATWIWYSFLAQLNSRASRVAASP